MPGVNNQPQYGTPVGKWRDSGDTTDTPQPQYGTPVGKWRDSGATGVHQQENDDIDWGNIARYAIAPIPSLIADYTGFDEGFEAGSKHLAAGLTYLISEVPNNPLLATPGLSLGLNVFDYADDWEEIFKKSAKKIRDSAPEDDGSTGYFLGQLVPSIVPTVGAALVSMYNPPAGYALGQIGLATLTGSSMGMGLMEYDEYKESNNLEKNGWERWATGLGYAAAEYFMERLSLGKILGKTFDNGLLNGAKTLILKSSPEAAEKFGNKIALDFVEKYPSDAKKLFGKIVNNSGWEGLTEAGTELAQTAIDNWYREIEHEYDTDQIIDRVTTAFIGGAIMGGAVSPLTFASENVAHNNRREAQGGVVLTKLQGGETAEIISKIGDTQYRVMFPSGREKDILIGEAIEQYELSVPQFKNMLKGGYDKAVMEEAERNKFLEDRTVSAIQAVERVTQKYPPLQSEKDGDHYILGTYKGVPVLAVADTDATGAATPNQYRVLEMTPDQNGTPSMIEAKYTIKKEELFNEKPITPQQLVSLVSKGASDQMIYDPKDVPTKGMKVDMPENVFDHENLEPQVKTYTVRGFDARNQEIQLEDEDGDFYNINRDIFEQFRAQTQTPTVTQQSGVTEVDNQLKVTPNETIQSKVDLASERVFDMPKGGELKVQKQPKKDEYVSRDKYFKEDVDSLIETFNSEHPEFVAEPIPIKKEKFKRQQYEIKIREKTAEEIEAEKLDGSGDKTSQAGGINNKSTSSNVVDDRSSSKSISVDESKGGKPGRVAGEDKATGREVREQAAKTETQKEKVDEPESTAKNRGDISKEAQQKADRDSAKDDGKTKTTVDESKQSKSVSDPVAKAAKGKVDGGKTSNKGSEKSKGRNNKDESAGELKASRKAAPTPKAVKENPRLKDTDGTNRASTIINPLAAERKTKVEETVDAVTKKWKVKPDVQVYESVLDYLLEPLQEGEQQRAISRPLEARAFFDPTTGKVIIFANHPQMNTLKEVERVFMHEAVGHGGFDGMIRQLSGDDQEKYNREKKRLLKEIYIKAIDDTNYEFTNKIAHLYFRKNDTDPLYERENGKFKMVDYTNGLTETQRDELAEEFIAHKIEDGYNGSISNKVVSFARKLWRQITGQESKLNDNDIKAILYSARKVVTVGDTVVWNPKVRGQMFGEKFSRQQTETKEFKAWFGDSKVVDENGKPLVVYHGTPSDFDEFTPSKMGELGSGMYFTASISEASDYSRVNDGVDGANIMPVYLSIQNPIKIKNAESFWKKYNPNNKPADEVINELKEKGIDGVILNTEEKKYDPVNRKFYKTGKQREHYVAFSPNQIKSATGNNGKFDSNNPDIRFSRTNTPAAYDGDFLTRSQENPNSPSHKYTQFIKDDLGRNYSEDVEPPKYSRAIEESEYHPHMTEDGDDYIFFHFSDKSGLTENDPSKFGSNYATSRAEKSRSVPATFFYTKLTDKEALVGDSGYYTRVPKEKVYPTHLDPENYLEEAKRRFRAVRGEDAYFDPNNQVGYITKIASENGYDVAVARWALPKGYYGTQVRALRAETINKLPLSKLTQEDRNKFKPNWVKEKMFEPEPVKYSRRATGDEIVNSVKETGGITLNTDGSIFKGKSGYVVSVLSQNVNSIEEAPDEVNKALQKLPEDRDEFLVGVFDMGDGTYSIDTNILVKSREEAINIGKEFDQKAIWDVKAQDTIDTGGTGQMATEEKFQEWLNNSESTVSETGEVFTVNVNGNIPNNGKKVKLSRTIRTFNESDVKYATLDELKGASAFVFAADQATSGMVTSPTGYEHEFMGGAFYPYLDNVGGWAFTDEASAKRVLDKVNETDGIGLVMIRGKSGIIGSGTFFDYTLGELQKSIDAGNISRGEVLNWINSKLDLKLNKYQTFRDYIEKKTGASKFNTLSQLKIVLGVDNPRNKRVNYATRGAFLDKIFNAEFEKKTGIPRLKYGKVKNPGESMLDYVNDPAFKDMDNGDVVSAIRFEKGSEIIDTRKDDSYKHHPSYPFIIKGKPLFFFEEAYDIRDVAPDFVPAGKEGNKTPLKDRLKPHAAKSAEGGQPQVRFSRSARVEFESIQDDDVRKELDNKYKKWGGTDEFAKQFTSKDGDFIVAADINKTKVRAAKIIPGERLEWDSFALFDDSNPEYLKGYSHNVSVFVPEKYRRLGVASAMYDFAEEHFGKPIQPSDLVIDEGIDFWNNRKQRYSRAFSDQIGNDFYSNSMRVVDKINLPKATGDQWTKALLNAGASRAELDWMGFDDFIKENPKPTKDEVLEFMEGNKVEVLEVVNGEPQINMDSKYATPDVISAVRNSSGSIKDNIHVTLSNDYNAYQSLSQFPEIKEMMQEDEDWTKVVTNDLLGGVTNNDTKYSEYTVPGGSNYKELLLTLGSVKRSQTFSDYLKAYRERFPNSPYTDDEVRGYYNKGIVVPDSGNLTSKSEAFTSSHFDEPNILAHLRLNERTDTNGNRVLFIEEMQSDWSQEGREKGFDNPEAKTEFEQYSKELANKYGLNPNHNLSMYATLKGITKEEVQKYNNLQAKFFLRGIPNTPFKTTDQWLKLTFRKAIRYAAENGFDAVAWTNGEQQVERYDLSKQVKEVSSKYNSKNDTYNVAVNTGTSEIPFNNKKADELEEIIGKELTKKLVEDSKNNPYQVYSGLDLKVGGEGMKAFYDSIVPKTAKKVLSKINKNAAIREFEFGLTPKQKERLSTLTERAEEDIDSLTESEQEEWNRLAKDNGDQGSFKTLGFELDPATSNIAQRERFPLYSRRLTLGGSINEQKGSPQYIAFSPTQIKSATGNQGTFDPSNPDIRYSRIQYDANEKIPEQSSLYLRYTNHIDDDLKRNWSSWNFGAYGFEGSSYDLEKEITDKIKAGGEEFNISGFDIWVDENSKLKRLNNEVTLDDYVFRELYKNYWVAVDDFNAKGGLSVHALDARTINDAIKEKSNMNLTGTGDGESIDATNNTVIVYEGDDFVILADNWPQDNEYHDTRYSRVLDGTFTSSQSDFIISDIVDRFHLLRRLQESKSDNLPDDLDAYTKENLSKGKINHKLDEFGDKYFKEFKPIYKGIADKGLTYDNISRYLKAKHIVADKVVSYKWEKTGDLYSITIDGGKTQSGLNEEGVRGLVGDNGFNTISREVKTQESKNGKLKNPSKIKGEFAGGGIPIDEAKNIVEDFEKKAGKDLSTQLNDHIKRINRFTNEQLLATGLISKQEFDDRAVRFKHYVPLRGFAEAENDRTIFTANIARKGRESESGDPIPYLYALAQTAIVKGEQNMVKKSLLDFVKEFPDSKLYQIRNTYIEKQGDEWVQTYVKPKKGVEYKRKVGEITGTDIKIKEIGGEHGVIDVMVDGRKVVIDFIGTEGKRIADTFRNADLQNSNVIIGTFRKMNDFLRGMYTQYSPEFVFRNFVRDMFTGMVNIKNDFGLGTMLKIAGDVPNSWNTIRQVFRSNANETEDHKLFRRFMAAGAMTGYSDLKEVRQVLEQLASELNIAIGKKKTPLEFDVNVGGKKKTIAPVTYVKKLGEFIDNWNRVFENTVRFAAFKHLIKNGVSEQKAAIYAKDLTVNFNRKGAYSDSIGSFYLFFNASVQGTDRLLRPFGGLESVIKGASAANPLSGGTFQDLKDVKVDKKVIQRTIGTMIALPAAQVALSLINRMMAGDDDDGENYYDKLSDYTRTHNIVFAKWWEPGEFITIPLPYGYNVLFGGAEYITRYALGKETAAGAVLKTVAMSAESFSPLGSPNLELDAPEGALLEYVAPTSLKPVIELRNNQNFAGSPIYKEPSRYGVDTPDHMQYYDSVNPLLRSITTWLNDVTGGDSVQPGLIDLNPEKLEHFIGTYTGGVGLFANNTIATSINLGRYMRGETFSEGEFTVNQVPFIRNYIKTLTPGTDRGIYFDNSKKIKDAWGIYQKYLKGDTKAANEFRKENAELLQMYKYHKNIDKRIGNIEDAIDVMRDKGRKDQQVKLEAELNRLYKDFNKRVREVSN